MLLYYITDRTQFPGNEAQRRRRLLEKIAEAARCGVNFIQLREKNLSPRELEALARQAVQTISENIPKKAPENAPLGTENRQPATRLLINSRTDVALAVGADGVHLLSDDILPREVRNIWKQSSAGARSTALRAGSAREIPIIAVSCHSSAEVEKAAQENADFAVFAPVFEKRTAPEASPAGLEALRQASRHQIPVLALGGITLENASACVAASAAGIAAIRLFQENEIVQVLGVLRS